MDVAGMTFMAVQALDVYFLFWLAIWQARADNAPRR